MAGIKLLWDLDSTEYFEKNDVTGFFFRCKYLYYSGSYVLCNYLNLLWKYSNVALKMCQECIVFHFLLSVHCVDAYRKTIWRPLSQRKSPVQSPVRDASERPLSSLPSRGSCPKWVLPWEPTTVHNLLSFCNNPSVRLLLAAVNRWDKWPLARLKHPRVTSWKQQSRDSDPGNLTPYTQLLTSTASHSAPLHTWATSPPVDSSSGGWASCLQIVSLGYCIYEMEW